MARLSVCCVLLLVCLATAQPVKRQSPDPLAMLQGAAQAQLGALNGAFQQLQAQYLPMLSQLDAAFTGAALNGAQQAADAEGQLADLANAEITDAAQALKQEEQLAASAITAEANALGGALHR